ncbi:MAG: hypothetical protein TR69_WS6001000539 [candidate division WS6 bacterium OLB20]|uniref:Uncharacterized protein n=1 Tax=candidate division WS6 bacterium OLB20 TaxID=1617426 RepID=A0A136LXZ5_9BACT|nr:MAG: hypothetical protein TR69_WS6001000539 [candidate division WS6 bacterium OLB20]
MRNGENYQPAASLEGYYQDILAHNNEYDDALDRADMAHLRPHILRMRQAADDAFGTGVKVIGGEQSIIPLPKNLGKLIALRALRNHMGVIDINLRADHDMGRTERDVRALDLLNYGNQEGTASFSVMSNNYAGMNKGMTTINGYTLKDDHIRGNMVKFASQVRQLYPGNFPLGDETHRVLDMRAVEDWFACYGMNPDGTPIDAIPEHIQSLPRTDRRESAFEQIDIVLPGNLAQGHENWFLMLQRRLGIEAAYTVSEGVIDKMLLKNGGHEVLANMMLQARARLRDQGYEPVAMKIDEDSDLRTWYNLELDGVRMNTVFTDDSFSQIEVTHPVTGETSVVTVDEALADDSPYGISLRAVERVSLYSLAGLSGHITGGGSVYNADARYLLSAVDLPYYPIWSFAKKAEDGSPLSPVRYVSMALSKIFPTPEEARRPEYAQAYLHMQGVLQTLTGQVLADYAWISERLRSEDPESGTTITAALGKLLSPNVIGALDALRAGKVSLFDLAMSVPLDQAREELSAFLEEKGTGLSRTSSVSFTNRAGVRLDEFDGVRSY